MKLQFTILMAYFFCLSLATFDKTMLNIQNSTFPGYPVPSVNKAWNTSGDINNQALALMVQTQAFIWTAIFIAIISIVSVCAMCNIDDPKTRDSLLYAKFLTNMKDK